MTQRKSTRLPAVLLLLVLLLISTSALASPLDLYGLSSRSMGMGGAVTAGVRDYSALFYNPGRLAYVKPQFGVHFIGTIDAVAIRLRDRPSGFDVPDDVFNALPLDSSATKMAVRYLPTSQLNNARKDTTDDPNLFAISGGIVHNFGLHWMAVGLAFSVPVTSIASADFHYVDEREQFFSNRLEFQLLNRRAHRPSILGGIAFRPIEWFGFGASINVFGNLTVNTKMFIPDALDQQRIHFLIGAEMKYDANFTAGMQFEPLPWMGIGITFRDESWMSANVQNKLQFWNFEIYEGEPITIQNFNYAAFYSPRQLAAGLRFDFGQWTVSADTAWVMWHFFEPEVRPESDKFRDVVTAKAGVEWRAMPWMDVRAGAGWVPSPVPVQDGRTNFVDNDRVETSAGFSFYLPWVEGLAIDLHGQWYILLDREHFKTRDANDPIIDEFPDARDIKTDEPLASSAGLQTNNPGFPGYSSSGYVVALGIGLTYTFK